MLNECTGSDKSKEKNNKEKEKQWLRTGVGGTYIMLTGKPFVI